MKLILLIPTLLFAIFVASDAKLKVPKYWDDTICVRVNMTCDGRLYTQKSDIDLYEYNWIVDTHIHKVEFSTSKVKFCATAQDDKILEEPYLCIRHTCHGTEKFKYVQLHRDFITSVKKLSPVEFLRNYQPVNVELYSWHKNDDYCKA